MAEKKEKLAENVLGRFYVDSTCISCVSCHSIAPDFFKLKNGNEYSFVYKQPGTQRDLEICEEALRECPVNAIGNDGGEPDPFNAGIAESIRNHADRVFLQD